MNNFVFSGQDPLLFQTYVNRGNNLYNDTELKQQMDIAMTQYQNVQQQLQQPQQKQQQNIDYLGELDNLTKNIDPEIAERLNADAEYMRINAELQILIQEEMLRNVKWRINSNPDAINRMSKLKEMIMMVNKEKNDEDRKNMVELNDYIKNYSDLTFDEYKRLKNKK